MALDYNGVDLRCSPIFPDYVEQTIKRFDSHGLRKSPSCLLATDSPLTRNPTPVMLTCQNTRPRAFEYSLSTQGWLGYQKLSKKIVPWVCLQTALVGGSGRLPRIKSARLSSVFASSCDYVFLTDLSWLSQRRSAASWFWIYHRQIKRTLQRF